VDDVARVSLSVAWNTLLLTKFMVRLGDIINKWRKSIDLEEVAMFDAPMLTKTLKIPFTYCWSPALVPKPVDWEPYIGRFEMQDMPCYR
jgi:hypothetical protein